MKAKVKISNGFVIIKNGNKEISINPNNLFEILNNDAIYKYRIIAISNHKDIDHICIGNKQ